MKKYLLLFISLVILSDSFSFSVNRTPVIQASQIFINVGKAGTKISLLEISKMSVKDYEVLAKTHLNFLERMNFRTVQKKIRKNINPDGTVNSKMIGKNAMGDAFSGFNIGGFVLGLLLFLPGVLIAYLIGGEERSTRVRWAWYGAGIFAIIALGLLRTAFT